MFICPAGHHVDHILPKRQLTFKLFVFVYQTVYPFLFFKNVFLLTNQLIYEHKPLKIFAACTARSADDAPNKMSTKEEEEDMRKSF